MLILQNSRTMMSCFFIAALLSCFVHIQALDAYVDITTGSNITFGNNREYIIYAADGSYKDAILHASSKTIKLSFTKFGKWELVSRPQRNDGAFSLRYAPQAPSGEFDKHYGYGLTTSWVLKRPKIDDEEGIPIIAKEVRPQEYYLILVQDKPKYLAAWGENVVTSRHDATLFRFEPFRTIIN